MAESVRYHLEKMIPELNEYTEKELFTPTQITQIVKQRTHWEYKIHKRIPSLQDHLDYIHYEINLYNLVHKKANRLGIKITRNNRVNGLYSNMLKKFNTTDLWVQYLDYTSKNSSKFHTRALAR